MTEPLTAERPAPDRQEEADDWWLVRAVPGLMLGAGLVAVAAAVLVASNAGISHRAREVITVGRFEITLIYTVPSSQMVIAGLLTALALVLLVDGVEAWASRRITEPARQARQALERPLRREAVPELWAGALSVTALIPANNEEAHLAGTLSSLQNQTMPPKAIWVIADNCTDRTADVARAHGANVYTTVDNRHRKAGGLNQLLERL
ncbi:MAG: glycosyltransferase, partial [Acidimicrobiia bacterium]|nr:glycosyltransferase [Acidimicrobiia bacterium]